MQEDTWDSELERRKKRLNRWTEFAPPLCARRSSISSVCRRPKTSSPLLSAFRSTTPTCVCVIVCGEKCNCESTLNSPPPYTIHSGCALWETLTSVEAEKRKSNQQDLAVVAAGSNAGEGTGRKYIKPTKNYAAERKQRERESKCLKSRMHGKRLL